jgi:hypothetical protein
MDDEARPAVTRSGCPTMGKKSPVGAILGPASETEGRAATRVACSRTITPRDVVLCEPSEVPESTRNLPSFEKSPAKYDELGAVSTTPMRLSVESFAKDTQAGRCPAGRAELVRRILAPSDERQLTGSMLDGHGNGPHYGYLNITGMGTKCRDGSSGRGISHGHARTPVAGSTPGARRIAFFAVCVRRDRRESANASRCYRRGRSPRCPWGGTQNA